MNLITGNHSILSSNVPSLHHFLGTVAFLLAEVLDDEFPLDFPAHAQASVRTEVGVEHIADFLVVDLDE